MYMFNFNQIVSAFILTILLICFVNNENLENDPDYSDDNSSNNGTYDEYCSARGLVDEIKHIFLPEDYTYETVDIKTSIKSFSEYEFIIRHLNDYKNNVTENLSDIVKIIGNEAKDVFLNMNISPECSRSVLKIFKAIQNGEVWAQEFISSQATIGQPFGEYDQCLNIKSPDINDPAMIKGKYCGLNVGSYIPNDPDYEPNQYLIDVLNNSTFLKGKIVLDKYTLKSLVDFIAYDGYNDLSVLGICLPDKCDPIELSQAISSVIYPILKVPVSFNKNCDFKDKELGVKTYQLLIILTFTVLFLIVSMATWIDLSNEPVKQLKSMSYLIKCFSARVNFNSLIESTSNANMKCLDGLRVILTFMIVLFHTYQYNGVISRTEYSAARQVFTGYRKMFINNYLYMDLFMLIAGVVRYQSFSRGMTKNNGKFGYFHFILSRYFRFASSLIALICFAQIYELFGSGPIWKWCSTSVSNGCRTVWYRPLLMINNFIGALENKSVILFFANNCLLHSWYISSDFQISVLLPLILIPLYKSPELGKILIIMITISTSIIPIIIKNMFEIPTIDQLHLWPNFLKFNLSSSYNYQAFWNYIPAYLIGILLGRSLVKFKQNQLDNKISHLILLGLSVASTAILFWMESLDKVDNKCRQYFGYEPEIVLFVQKFIYISPFVWIIYLCVTGKSDYINNILGLKIFRILKNSILEIYLIQPFILIYRIGITRELINFSDYTLWTYALTDFFVSYLLAIILSLIMIKPFYNISTIFINKILK